jgi:hypothetical protein
MNDTPSPFAPFQLPNANPIGTEVPTETAKQKAAREKREAKAASKAPAEANKDADTTVRPPRKKPEKKGGFKVYSPKFELQAILAVAATFNEDDFPLFEKLVIQFDEMGKPARERILAAIGKVFA